MKLIFRAILVVTLVGLFAAACADDDPEVDAGAPGVGDDGGGDGGGLAPPDRSADYAGTITKVTAFVPITEGCTDPDDLDPDGAVSSDDPPVCTDPDSTVKGTVLLEEDPGAQQGDKISLTVDGDTVLLRRTSSGYEPITFADLDESVAGEAWVEGAVADSYPQQGGATALVIDPTTG
jgi:hypothetical protein